MKQLAKRILPKRLHRFARGVYERITYRARPQLTRFPGDAEGVLECCVAYNKYGAYCVPLSAHHRPAAQRIFAGDVWEPQTIEFLRSHCGAGDVVHAGTFFGDFLPALSRACAAGAQVWAFEPNPESYRCAALTIQFNGLENVTLTNAGLGAEPGALSLVTKDVDGSALGGLSRLSTDDRGVNPSDSVTVRIATIDETVPADRHVSIIQLDVEGFEGPALAGARTTIERCGPILLLENLPDERWMADNILCLGYRAEGEVHGNVILTNRTPR